MIENLIVFDIETISANNCELFKPNFKLPRKNKDGTDNKADKPVSEQEAEWRSKLALSPLTGAVACISYIRGGEPECLCGEERSILSQFVDLLKSSDVVVTHNGKSFDLWFIFNRCRKYGIEFPHKHYSKYKGRFSWNDSVIDTMELWGCGKYGEMISLNKLAKYFGLTPKDESIGKNFEQVFNEDREKAIEYAKHDITLTKQIYEKLTSP